jgi:hypothetical protein
MSLVIGARRHLEWGHEKYILETINSHPALVSISVLSFSLADYFLHKFVFLWKSSLVFKCSYRSVVMILVHICKWWWQLFWLLSLSWYPALLLIFLYKTKFGVRMLAHTHSAYPWDIFFTRCLVINSGSWHDLFSLWNIAISGSFFTTVFSDMFWIMSISLGW